MRGKSAFFILLLIIFLFCACDSFAQTDINYTKRERAIFESEIVKFKLADADTLVDIGAGSGIIDEIIFKYYPNLYFILEDSDNKYLSPGSYYFISKGRKEFFSDHSRKITGTADSIPLPSAQYKNVLCRITLHEFINPAKMLAEIKRLMTNDARLIIEERKPMFAGQIDGFCKKKLLSKEEIIAMLRASGFRLIAEETNAGGRNKGNANILTFMKAL